MDTIRGTAQAGPELGTRARGAARANLAGAFGMVLCSYGAPGSVLLTLFLQKWLNAEKWQIGMVMTMAFLGPTFEPLGAYLVEHFGQRRRLFITFLLCNRLPFLILALVPMLGEPEHCRDLGIALVLAVVAFTRVPAHLGTPAWWSWMADLVPERRRGKFFGLRSQAGSAMAACSFVAAMALLQCCGGMANRPLVSALFAVGALFGIADILLYLRVPEPPMQTSRRRVRRSSFWQTVQRCPRTLARRLAAPFRATEFRLLILGMGLWSFSANLVLPFLPIYQFGETLGGCQLGLGLSWRYLAVLNVASSLAAMLSSRWWARWGDRHGPRWLIILGSGYLFVNLAYLFVGPHRYIGLLVLVAVVGGALNAAWTVSSNQLILNLAPRRNRSFYVSAYNFTNGWLMAGGPILGGLLAGRLPVTAYRLPGGLPVCYFHILLGVALMGGSIALSVLLRSPALRSPQAEPRLEPAVPVDNAHEYATI